MERSFTCTKKLLSRINFLSPEQLKATTNVIGTFTPDPDALFNKAVAAGAKVSSPIQDYEYGYRQGIVIDPFGHQWLIQKENLK